jgi:hypothetical protein
MIRVSVEPNRILLGDGFSVYFLRTLRVPDDGNKYPLPPGLEEFPLKVVDDFPRIAALPSMNRGDLFIAMYQREALWLGFEGPFWKPNAVKVGIGHINAVTGAAWDETLHDDPQDYLVCPPQPWLDGFNTGRGVVRQFVAAPLGSDLTVESQLSDKEEGGLRLLVVAPQPGRFPETPPPAATVYKTESVVTSSMMGLAAGGEIEQKIYPDPYGLDVWDTNNFVAVRVHILNSEQYSELTGLEAPLTPIDARTYTQYGLPWFKLYDERLPDVAASKRLAEVKSLKDKDGGEDESFTVPESQVRKTQPSQKRK